MADAGADRPASDAPDAAPICAVTPGAAPAGGDATTFPCPLAPAPPPWSDCPAKFPGGPEEIAVLCRRRAPSSGTPDGVLAGTCGNQQVVVLNHSPGRGVECHYDAAGALVGVAEYADTLAYCGSSSAARAAGMVTRAPCLLDMEASWDSLDCESVAPACGDAGAADAATSDGSRPDAAPGPLSASSHPGRSRNTHATAARFTPMPTVLSCSLISSVTWP
jgi:hypothetical protein